jgi:hypothetical protein
MYCFGRRPTLASRYQVLSKMARDVLAVPISTVASESVFSTGGRILDPFKIVKIGILLRIGGGT